LPELALSALAPRIAGVSGARADAAPSGEGEGARPGTRVLPTFAEVYEQSFDFAWRSLRRLGVPEASIDDAVQDLFVVVHRRLGDFEGRSSLKTWIYGIALRVARDHQRLSRRKGGHAPLDPRLVDQKPGPVESLDRSEAVRELDRILGTLDEDKRAVFVLAEIEQMSAPEIAEALGVNVNTVYSRLRAARREVEAAVAGASR
jgi:RNA polymerase sigma-70 factor (ECF subfamily)